MQGPTFLLEYDNSQNNANHIHTVWRDFAGDFDRDLLLLQRALVPYYYHYCSGNPFGSCF